MKRHVIYKVEIQNNEVGQKQKFFETIDGYMQTVFGKQINIINLKYTSYWQRSNNTVIKNAGLYINCYEIVYV